jgi:hypothetical protein
MPKVPEKTRRVHILLYENDWQTLGSLYGDTVKRGQVIRALVRAHVRGIRARVEQRSASVASEPEGAQAEELE